jgi:hypothetical protein
VPAGCNSYYIINTTGVGLTVSFNYTDCGTDIFQSGNITVPGDGYELICSNSYPVITSNAQYVEVTYEGPCSVPTTTIPATTPPATYYPASRTSGQISSDDACNLFAFNGVWFTSQNPGDGSTAFSDSNGTIFNGNNEWYGIDLDGNGITFSARISPSGNLYSTTQCSGGGGF